VLLAGAALLVPVAAACSDGTAGWCDRLSEAAPLNGLAAAVSGTDPTAARDELDDLRALAGDAPAEIRRDMDRIVSTLEELVDLVTSPAAAGSATERQRDRVDQQLAQVTDHTSRVASWAEQECGLRLE